MPIDFAGAAISAESPLTPGISPIPTPLDRRVVMPPRKRKKPIATIEELLQFASQAKALAARLEQAKLEKASEYVSFAVMELETLIQIAKFNRR
jgi:hypothetical protein